MGALVAVCLLASGPDLQGLTGVTQQQTSVTGLTTTLDGSVRLRGVSITVADSTTGTIVATTASDNQGRFALTELLPGTYILTASLEGFVTTSRSLIRRSHFTLLLPSQPGSSSRAGYPCAGRSGSPFWA